MKKLIKRIISEANDMIIRVITKTSKMLIKPKVILCSQRGEGFVDTASASVRA